MHEYSAECGSSAASAGWVDKSWNRIQYRGETYDNELPQYALAEYASEKYRLIGPNMHFGYASEYGSAE